MRRFQFRFQRVLDVKERLEDVRKASLGQVVGACELITSFRSVCV